MLKRFASQLGKELMGALRHRTRYFVIADGGLVDDAVMSITGVRPRRLVEASRVRPRGEPAQ